ncbi:hypothetical protein LTR56_003186 [Elasticomyces elasticus]|nr:hypothetical protein LTR22_010719 [Elasticomyces elasticus]KAK3656054.1 hypothetical protein LTR56_003186 [Elasticomyces elasticus]KAK4920884.1 hypothetical protein LTR49_011606 [Elasticomyces elasticus]KAK5759600.1 hypothetical protein LTS12_010293 [Elasticomyces elasticus]
MDDLSNELLSIKVGSDDYADAAAQDAPVVSRTYQSEEAFRKIAYTAINESGNNYERLLKAIPALDTQLEDPSMTNGDGAHVTHRTSKRDGQLLGYAVGELYYDKRFQDIIQLCERVKLACTMDGKTAESLQRWTQRCEQRMKTDLNGSMAATTTVGEHDRP